MSKLFKVFCVVFVCLCVFTLAACGGANKEKVVADAINNYLAQNPEREGSIVISNLLTDDGDGVILEMKTPTGDTYNLLVAIERITFTFDGYAYDYIPGEIKDNKYDHYSVFMDYILVRCRQKQSLDMEKINSNLN